MTHEERDEFIHGLRELADFLDAHPTVEVPIYAMLNVFVNTKDELAAHARTATWEKVYNGNWFTLRKEFGTIKYEINATRDTVCRKVVKGTRVVPARPEHTVEEVEWVCEEALLS